MNKNYVISGCGKTKRGTEILEVSADYKMNPDYTQLQKTTMDIMPVQDEPALGIVPTKNKEVRFFEVTLQPGNEVETRPHALQHCFLLKKEEFEEIAYALDDKELDNCFIHSHSDKQRFYQKPQKLNKESSSFWQKLTEEERWNLFNRMIEIAAKEECHIAINTGNEDARKIQSELYRILPDIYMDRLSTLSSGSCAAYDFNLLFYSDKFSEKIDKRYYQNMTVEELLAEKKKKYDSWTALKKIITGNDDIRYQFFEFMKVRMKNKKILPGREGMEKLAREFQGEEEKKEVSPNKDTEYLLEEIVEELTEEISICLEREKSNLYMIPEIRSHLFEIYQYCNCLREISFVRAMLLKNLFEQEVPRKKEKLFVQVLMLAFEMTNKEYMKYRMRTPYITISGPYDFGTMREVIHQCAGSQKRERRFLKYLVEIQLETILGKTGSVCTKKIFLRQLLK